MLLICRFLKPFTFILTQIKNLQKITSRGEKSQQTDKKDIEVDEIQEDGR